MEWLWGYKTVALFDVWSIEHILSGLSIGSLVIKARRAGLTDGPGPASPRTPFQVDLLGVLFLSYLWETVEHYLEAGLWGPAVTYWFAGVEMWGNRMITDPLMVLLGYLIVAKNPRLAWPARVLSATWLLVHIFVFPHCMYLHDLMRR